ncbi:MAG TPA: PAS domain S-box protein, partial [Smithellaceae bacterium]|nr:PAS domain S-box protein [Smithellaceae bacterium]
PHEYRIRRKDGTYVDIDARATMVYHAGKPHSILGIARDITERRKLAADLRDSEQLLKNTEELSKTGGWLYDVAKKSMTWTEEVYRIYGVGHDYDPGDINKDISFYSAADRKTIADAFAKAVHEAQSYLFELQFNAADGRQKWVRTMGCPVMQDGKVLKVFGNIADISHEKQAERALKEMAMMLEATIESSPLALIVLNSDDQVIIWNPAAERLFGWNKKEIIGQPIPTIPESKIREFDSISEYVNRKENVGLSRTQRKRKDGSLVDVSITVAPVINADGKVVGKIGLMADITGNLMAERKLRESESRYRSIFENIPDMYYRTDDKGCLTMISPAGVKMLGYESKDELIGKNITAILYYEPQGRNKILSFLQAKGEVRDFEITLRHKNGSTIPCSASSHYYYNAEHNIIGIEGLIRDISERKQAENILRESNEKYQQLFEMESDALFLIDNETGNILEVNESAAKIYGFRREELLRMNHADVSAEPAETRRVTLKGEILVPIRWHRKSDGTVFPVEITASHFIWKGRTVHLAAIRDITERRRIEDALKENEAKYRLLAEKMTDIVWIQDLNLRTTYVSPSIAAALGFTPEERMAQNVREQLTPASLSRALDILTRELALEQEGSADPERTITFEAEYYHKNGSILWFENIISGIRDQHGALTGLHGVSRSINRRKKTEEALRESEKKYRVLVDFLPIAVSEMDINGNIISGNQAVFNLFGYTPEDLKNGLNIAQMFSPKDMEKIRAGIHTILNGEKTKSPEYTGIRKDGTTFPLIAFSSPLIRNGNPLGIRVAIVDITERKQSEEALRKINLSLAHAQRIAHIGNWELDVKSNNISCSEETYNILGIYPRPANNNMEKCLESTHPEDRETVRRAINRTITEKAKSDITSRIIRGDGSIREVRIYMEPICDDNGIPVSVTGIIQDITERNKTARELQGTQNMLLHTEKLAAIGRLSAGVAHEILNPVNIISMELQILQATKSLPPVIKEELRICMEQINRIVRITDTLKQFSRIPGEKMAAGNINEIIARVLDLYSMQLRIEGVDIEVHYQPDLPDIVLDKTKIEEVIFNLFANAMDAMKGKDIKLLRISTKKEIGKGNREWLKITIADTGTGIKDEYMSSIFDPFFTTKEPGKGTGLGLSISYSIVHEHGGEIWAENNKWGGATFQISLPVKTNTGEGSK